MNDLITHPTTAPSPVQMGNAFDLMLPLLERSDSLLAILELAAHLTIERDEQETPDAYADPDFRRQEVKRRTLKGITDLRQIANMLELRWAIQNGHETWTDADGAEVSLLEVLETQMPDEEKRASSGRARQVWSFLDTAQAFRDEGISDQQIAECARSGLSSVLGITAATQRKLADATPPDELRDKYETLIEMAASTTTLDWLQRQVRTLVDPTDTPPPPIPYSMETDGAHCWLVLRPTRDQWTELVRQRLKDVLELDALLPEAFARFWRSASE